jgi:hypothetical protein
VEKHGDPKMTEQQMLLKRFEATKVANFNESIRLEGLKPIKDKSALPAKVIAKLKQLQSAELQ